MSLSTRNSSLCLLTPHWMPFPVNSNSYNTLETVSSFPFSATDTVPGLNFCLGYFKYHLFCFSPIYPLQFSQRDLFLKCKYHLKIRNFQDQIQTLQRGLCNLVPVSPTDTMTPGNLCLLTNVGLYAWNVEL